MARQARRGLDAEGRGAERDHALSAGLDPRRPALLTLRVRDMARALEFWHERFGLPVKLRVPGCVELQSETILLVLAEGDAGAGGATLSWEVGNLDEARAELTAKGITCEDVALPAGADAAVFGRRVAFRDPDGHRLELVSWA